MKRKNHERRSSGFTLFEAIIMSVILGVLIAVFLPALMAPKRRASRINCINNLKQIGLAFRQWGMDYNDKFPMQVSVTNGGTMELVGSRLVAPHFQVLSNELNTPKILVCVEDKKRTLAYSFAMNLDNSNVSYFVGVDARPDNHAMLLSGDANWAVGGKPIKPGLLSLWTNASVAWAKPPRPYHGKGGNIVTVDGSAHQVGDVSLRELLHRTGVATNRLATP